MLNLEICLHFAKGGEKARNTTLAYQLMPQKFKAVFSVLVHKGGGRSMLYVVN